ncbi:hypothetical protein [Polyangium jinanense]|uniref:Uncharacterized protein n=1 Tax=Polyangium jinanense TaxID=2829994 RepID=A0A9X3X4S0_9BACT|nr:hypothetical protein [Polyangium jinanense]MDC3954813.1 hypothetical protein [Polyangium jinanense]MDC3981416.1 hypothetical protein [Polyangium jinanense]
MKFRAAVPFALALALSACSMSAPPCLTGAVPQVGRPVPDEMFALMRRERERAERASPLVRAHILETIPRLFPDVSDLLLAPPCDEELEAESAAAFDEKPLHFTRLLVARIRTVHDAEILMALVKRDEASITEYELGPDEPGPRPPKSFVRYLALASIPAFWVVSNVPEGGRLLLDRVRKSKDAREQLLLHDATSAIYEHMLWGHPERAVGDKGPAILRGSLPEIKRRLAGPADAASLELVLLQINDLGTYGVRFGLEREARALVNEILAAKGEVPLTQGTPGAARDLAEVARGALFDLDTPQKSVSGVELPRPRRDRMYAQEELLYMEPGSGKVPEAAALARVRELDQELETLRFNAPRCYVLNELGRWLPPAEASRRFDAFIAPIFDGERIRLDTESVCRMDVALGLDGVDEARRVKLLEKLLTAKPEQVSPRDRSRDEHHPAIAYPADEQPLWSVVARALLVHPGWIERHAGVRAWLEQQALAPIPIDSATAEVWKYFQPSFERVITFHASGAPGASMDTARAILRGYMQPDPPDRKKVAHIYFLEVSRARTRALGEYGKLVGLVPEITAYLEERKTERAAAIALHMLNL